MDADPRPHLGFVVAVHFAGKALTSRNVKRRLTTRMPGMKVRPLVTLALFGSHRDENAVEKRQSSHWLLPFVPPIIP